MKSIPLTRLASTVMLATGMSSLSAHAAITLGSTQGYEASVSGSIPVFLVLSSHDSPKGSSTDGEDAARIQSGFNPANVTFHVKAPTTEGISVSAHVQYNTHLQGKGTQDSGLFESRVAEIQVGGSFGTVSLGKGFGIFNSSAIGDIGSGKGVGWLGGGADTANATGGHIGTGYVYANFNPHIVYTSPDMGGIKYKLGLINPEEPAGYPNSAVETNMPRLEGQLDYTSTMTNGGLRLWVGFMHQNVSLTDIKYDYNMTGVDLGGHLDVGMFGLTLAYTDTEGVGADGLYGFNTDGGAGVNDAEVKATQWYLEADIQSDKTTYGLSYGEGQQDAEATSAGRPVGPARDITNKLGMLFVHHKLTPAFTLIGEVQDYSSEAQADYNAVVVGAQYDF